MAIFSGTWLDDAGTPFDPASFAIQTATTTSPIVVTGDPNPDCTGLYIYAGLWHDNPYYEREDLAYGIYYARRAETWFIDTDPTKPWEWENLTPATITGSYDPIAPQTGNPIVRWQDNGICRLSFGPARGRRRTGDAWRKVSPHQRAARQAFADVTRHYVKKTDEEAMLVTGAMVPDITGWYGIAEAINNADAWTDGTLGFYIYLAPTLDFWIISASPPDTPGGDIDWWQRADPDPEGAYIAQGTAVGNAVVGYEP